MVFTFPLPLACVPQSFAPAWHEFSDEEATTFLYAAPPAAGLLTALQTPAASLAPVASLDLVHDVTGSGRLQAGALARLHAAAASGAPWWLVIHNLEGVDSSARAVNGGNLLMMLLERRAGARYEGLDLTKSAALLLAADGSDLRTLRGRWGALAAQAQQASRGQTPLNPEALFARIAKADFSSSSSSSGGGGMAQWNAALHSPACRGARGGAGRAHHLPSGTSLAAAALYACAGLVLLAVVAIAVLYFVGGARAAPGSSSGSGGSGGKVQKNLPGAARQRGNSRPPSPSRGSGARG